MTYAAHGSIAIDDRPRPTVPWMPGCCDPDPSRRVRHHTLGAAPSVGAAPDPLDGSPRLMSATAIVSIAGFVTAFFVGAVVRDQDELRACVARHCGRGVAALADVRSGFDQFDPVAVWLVSEKTGDLLAAAAIDPAGPAFRGLLVVLRQRVVA